MNNKDNKLIFENYASAQKSGTAGQFAVIDKYTNKIEYEDDLDELQDAISNQPEQFTHVGDVFGVSIYDTEEHMFIIPQPKIKHEAPMNESNGLDMSTVGQLVDHLDTHFEEHEPIQFVINDQPVTLEYIEHEGLGEGPVQFIFTSK